MLQLIHEAVASLPEDGLLYLIKKLTDKTGFFVANKHLLYVVSNCDHEESQSISTEYLHLNTNVEIHAFAENQQFKSGKYNVLDLIPTDGKYDDVNLQSFVNLCSAHALYMDSGDFIKFFFSLINIFQIPAEQAYKNLVGLFGELSVIKYIYEQSGIDTSGDWHKTGSNGKYDFVLKGFNLEVKSTASEDGLIELKHLQIFNSDKNYLAVVLLEKNNAGISTNQLIQSLLTAPDYCNNYNFAINIEKEKKRISPSEAENMLFSVRAINFYDSATINPLPLIPDEISALSYKLDLSEKEPVDFEIIMKM